VFWLEGLKGDLEEMEGGEVWRGDGSVGRVVCEERV
jgi:hypothetical protein